MDKTLKRLDLYTLLLAGIFLCLIPAAVYAMTQSNYFLGMSGVTNSNLYIGMSGVSGSRWYIGFNVPAQYINPSAPVGTIINLIPFIFTALAVLALLMIGFSEGFTPIVIILLAVAIYIAIALLMGMHSQIGGVIGGY